EGVVLVRLEQLGELLQVLLHVDVAHRVVAEDPEVAVEVQVDGGGLHARAVERVDDDAAGLDLLADGAVGEDHRRATLAADRGGAVGRAVPGRAAGRDPGGVPSSDAGSYVG